MLRLLMCLKLYCVQFVAKKNKTKVAKFYANAKEDHEIGRSHVNLLLNIAELCYSYPKFKCVSYSIRGLKNNLSKLRKAMLNDSFWK